MRSRASAIVAIGCGALAGTAAWAAESWTRSTQANGAVFYACASDGCGRGATISCRVMPPDTVTSSGAFAARIAKQVADLAAVGRDIVARPVTQEAMGERVLHRTALFYRGTVPAFETGFLVGPGESFAVISTASDAKTMTRNFDRFVARLASRPVGIAAAECPP